MQILQNIIIGIATAVYSIPVLLGFQGGVATKTDVSNSLEQTRIEIQQEIKNQQAIISQALSDQERTFGAVNPVGGKLYYLYGGGISSSQTSVTLTAFKTPVSNYNLGMSDFGTIGYATIEPGNATKQEFISFTGVTQNVDGTATLTGVSRGLSPITPYTASTTIQKAHSGGSIVVLSNPPAFYSNFTNKNNDETITGQWTFDNFPITSTNATSSETISGISELATLAEVLANTQTGSTGGRLIISTAVATTTYNSATAAGAVIAADASGKIDNNFIGTVGVPTGSITAYATTTPPSGWLLADGTAVSRTTYSSLYSLLGTSYGVGDGSTTFNLPNLSSRIIVGSGTGTKVATFASRSSNVITVTGLTNAANNEFQTGQAVLYSAPSGAMTGLTHNTTYYLIRTGNLTFSLASSLANAQNGTVISLSSDGTGTQTFTLTLTARTLGDTGGEENHAMNSTELLAHDHDITDFGGHTTYLLGGGGTANTRWDSGGGNGPPSTNVLDVLSSGGNAAMNNMQPFVVLNYIIKY